MNKNQIYHGSKYLKSITEKNKNELKTILAEAQTLKKQYGGSDIPSEIMDEDPDPWLFSPEAKDILDELRFYNRILSPEEIYTLYKNPSNGDSNQFYVGGASGSYNNIDIGAVLCYGSALTPTEVRYNHNQLSGRYGIGIDNE